MWLLLMRVQFLNMPDDTVTRSAALYNGLIVANVNS